MNNIFRAVFDWKGGCCVRNSERYGEKARTYTVSEIARILGVGPIRKIGRENRIGKSTFFISKAGKIVRSQLAGIQRKMYKIVPVKQQKRTRKTITKKPL